MRGGIYNILMGLSYNEIFPTHIGVDFGTFHISIAFHPLDGIQFYKSSAYCDTLIAECKNKKTKKSSR